MNAFTRVINEIGAQQHHHNEAGWFHSLLVLGAALYDTDLPDSTDNPVVESIRRLELAGVGKPTLDRVKQILNDADTKFRTGRRF